MLGHPRVREELRAAVPAARRAAAHGMREFARKFLQEYARERRGR